MTDKFKKTLIGALIAVALAAATSYGLISQQTADSIKSQADQALTESQSAPPSAPQQPAPAPSPAPSPAPQNSGEPTPPPVQPAPQSPAPAARP